MAGHLFAYCPQTCQLVKVFLINHDLRPITIPLEAELCVAFTVGRVEHKDRTGFVLCEVTRTAIAVSTSLETGRDDESLCCLGSEI